jgi:hypothetical protein
MRKKVGKTVKASDDNTTAQLHVAAPLRPGFPSTRATYDDTVAQLRVAAYLHWSFPCACAGSTNNNSVHYANFYLEQLEMPFKKHQRSNKKIGEPEHQKTMAFAYQVSQR